MAYDREQAVAYAHKWALERNPIYYNFDSIGGDCTNFVSQCLLAGCGRMNYKRDVGWYYNSLHDRSAAWTGVEYLHRFLTGNKGAGPYGTELAFSQAEPGDIIQLSFDGKHFSHSLFVTGTDSMPSIWSTLVCTHTYDAQDRPLSSYMYQKMRLIHLEGSRS